MSRRRFVSILLLLASIAAVWVYRASRDPWPAEQGIRVPPGEAAHTARVLASTIALLDRNHQPGQPFTRSAYAKSHGCLRATVSVPELPPRLRHGVFAHPAEYLAWVRFSNGSERPQSDQVRDARGFALKLMGVPGEKLLPVEKDELTQDFVMSDSPRAFVADVASYEQMIDHLSRGSRQGWFFGDWSWKPWRWNVRELWLATEAAGGPPASLLQTRYYSQTPYRLGPEQIVKYAVRPCQSVRPPRRDRTDGMLREGLKEELSLADGCFELLVQLQVPGRNLPVEDATVEWDEGDAPFLAVARVSIPKQAFDAPEQDRFCEALSFTPWHALPAHEPVGGLNRLRRAVYQEVSRYRHARNDVARAEPRGHCLDLTGQPCAAAVAEATESTSPAQPVVPRPSPSARPVPPAAPGSSSLPPQPSRPRPVRAAPVPAEAAPVPAEADRPPEATTPEPDSAPPAEDQPATPPTPADPGDRPPAGEVARAS